MSNLDPLNKSGGLSGFHQIITMSSPAATMGYPIRWAKTHELENTARLPPA